MKDLTLVILAAGMGSRFGGLKQIEPVGPNGEFIIDYSIYDAIKVGFTKVVFVIKKENYEVFKETIGKRVEDKIKVSYAFQELSDLPEGYSIPKEREKALGTAHAVYSARNEVEGNFAIISADDFYGRESFQHLKDFLEKENTDDKEHYIAIGYKAINTLSSEGTVKRGLCKIKGDYLTGLVESKVCYENDKLMAYPLDGSQSFEVTDNTLATMIMFGFNKNLMKHLEDNFSVFLDKNKDNLLTCEYMLPDVITKVIDNNMADVLVVKTNSKWYGVTYKEDKDNIQKAISEMIEKGIYKEKLWD